MIRLRSFTMMALLVASAAACEKPKPATKVQDQKAGNRHDHKEGDAHEHKEGDGHDHDKKEK